MTQPSVSFEFFPAKTPEAEEILWDAMQELSALNPRYMTVTYGAGGSTKEGTRETLKKAHTQFKIPMASHLTYLSTPKDMLHQYIGDLWGAGIKHLVTLRGDLPAGMKFEDFHGDQYYKLTSEFVESILRLHPFEISVAAYPEKHPDAPTLAADIEALRLKCAAGASQAITQFFFDNHLYYDFLEACDKAGIKTPIHPGLLPIHDLTGTRRFAKKCGASVPDWVVAEFQGYELKPEECEKIATEILCEQVEDLTANGVKHIHFYTLNKAEITKEACCLFAKS